MKKAKVSKGVVHHVWPWTKALADGRKVVKELPPQYAGLDGKPVPACIVDVPDEVQPKWVWNGTAYAPRVKKKIRPYHSDLIDVLADIIGEDPKELLDRILVRKKARRAAAKKD